MSGIDRRNFLKCGGVLLAGAGAWPLAVSARTPARRADPASLVHPELRAALEKFRALESTLPPLSAATLEQQRQGLRQFYQTPEESVPFEERRVPGRAGAPDVRVFVVNQGQGKARSAILHTHGGGFVLGEARGSIQPIQRLAAELGCVVVTVDYRLAPEAKWRASVADNYAALRWLHANAEALGVDGTRIALLGESAGGGHAALLAIAARDRGEVPVVMQALIYPMLDDRTGSIRSVPAHIGAFGWTAQSNRFGWRAFLGCDPGTAQVPAAAVPARTVDLAGLPPAFIGVGAIDLFVDEDVSYARRLIQAAVPTELVVVPGAFHGFDMAAPDSGVARQFRATWVAALRRALGETNA